MPAICMPPWPWWLTMRGPCGAQPHSTGLVSDIGRRTCARKHTVRLTCVCAHFRGAKHPPERSTGNLHLPQLHPSTARSPPPARRCPPRTRSTSAPCPTHRDVVGFMSQTRRCSHVALVLVREVHAAEAARVARPAQRSDLRHRDLPLRHIVHQHRVGLRLGGRVRDVGLARGLDVGVPFGHSATGLAASPLATAACQNKP